LAHSFGVKASRSFPIRCQRPSTLRSPALRSSALSLAKGLRSVGYCLSAALLLAVATTGDAFAAPKGKPTGKPLTLIEQGSFFVGGKLVFSPANFGAPGP